MGIVHTTAAGGVDSGDGLISKNAWNEAHTITTSVNAQSGTSYTLVIGDDNNVVELTNASAITLTIPPNGDVAFPVGAAVEIHQGGAGAVTVTPGSGVTILSRDSLVELAGEEAMAFIRKVATNTWRLTGDLA